jgi:hypothetical protein
MPKVLHREAKGGFANECFFIQVERQSYWNRTDTIANIPSDFVLFTRARLAPQSRGRWEVSLNRINVQQSHVSIDHGKRYRIQSAGAAKAVDQVSPHINPAGQWNDVMIVGRGKNLDLYVGDLFVTAMAMQEELGTGAVSFGLYNLDRNNAAPTAEWERLTIWPGDNVPTFDERRRALLK